MNYTHIINPFNGNAEHLSVQSITFASIKNAVNYASKISVKICAICTKEDEKFGKEFVSSTVILDKTISDYNPTLKGRELPTINDILMKGVEGANADYVIYSNIDIGLQENFYVVIDQMVNEGYDSFAINRRRVSDKYKSPNQLYEIYSDVGELHTGYDCFVMKKSLVKDFVLGNCCVGIPFVDSVLLFNMIAFSEKFKLFTEKHLTFHIGYDLVKEWGGKKFIQHNKKEYLSSLKQIKNKLELKNIPGSGYPFFKRHIKWLMNPTIHYPTVFSLDFKATKNRYNQSSILRKGYLEKLQKIIKLD